MFVSIAQWQKPNALFKHPITCTKTSMGRRLEKEWEGTMLVVRGKATKSQKAELDNKLDKLLDSLFAYMHICQPFKFCSCRKRKKCRAEGNSCMLVNSHILVDKTVELIRRCLSGDSTTINTCWKGGIIAWLEKMLGRKVIWVICKLHINELWLRHLFEEAAEDYCYIYKVIYLGPEGVV